MATLLSALETQARRHLIETTASFWTSAELIDILNHGIKDLWGAYTDLHQEHYFTNDITSVSIAADTATLSGVPTDVFRILLIEPKVTSSLGTYRGLVFVPRDYNHQDFVAARTWGSVTSSVDSVIYYTLSQAGAPVGAPTIHIAPTLSGAIAAGDIRLVYIPTIAAKVAGDTNPIPSESDNALIAWTVAYARAKEREDRSPDPNWLAVYATEKQNLLTRSTPRQEQEPELVDPMFSTLW